MKMVDITETEMKSSGGQRGCRRGFDCFWRGSMLTKTLSSRQSSIVETGFLISLSARNFCWDNHGDFRGSS
jgi:hypothetical protein